MHIFLDKRVSDTWQTYPDPLGLLLLNRTCLAPGQNLYFGDMGYLLRHYRHTKNKTTEMQTETQGLSQLQ